MTQVKHTPGPWNWVRGHSDWGMPRTNVILPKGASQFDFDDLIAEVHSQTPYCAGASSKDIRDSQTADANARLIAAAPDMLEALRGLVAEHLPEVEANYEYLLTEGNHAQIDQAESDLRKWQSARAAIAKATGESQ